MKKKNEKLNKFIGSEKEFRKKLDIFFGRSDFDKEIKKAKQNNIFLYLAVLGLAFIFFIFTILESFASIDLERNEYGEGAKIVPLKVVAAYGGKSLKRKLNLYIKPKKLSEIEKKERIEKTKKKLPSLILADNLSLNDIVYDLKLPEMDEETGVLLSWYVEEGSGLNKDGSLDIASLQEGENLHISVRLSIDNLAENMKIVSTVGNVKERNNYEPLLKDEIDRIVEDINGESDGNKVDLPKENSNGVKFKWIYKDLSRLILIGILGAISIFIIYKKRFYYIDKKIRIAKESISKDFPDFLNKLLLLLDAGLVVTSALNKIVKDYKAKKERRYLYDELSDIDERVNGVNASLCNEISDFAQRSGVRELMRFSNILIDNIDKGSMLNRKISLESEVLWNARKKRAEEKGLVAESKLTFPMALLLLVLIAITAAPAVMGM